MNPSGGETSSRKASGPPPMMPRTIPIVSTEHFVETLRRARRGRSGAYLAMYSSLWDGIVTDTALMQVPADDHMVHRGDGVFETCKCVAGGLYNLEGHLERLERSADSVGLQWPGGAADIREIAAAVVRAGGKKDCAVRLLLSRGPGGFGVNPYESSGPVLYAIVTPAGEPFMRRNPRGATVRRSRIPAKQPFFAGVKNCNYLPNVLMKKEAVDWNVDFVVGFDAEGFLAEGATENVGMVTREGELVFPRPGKVLRGTTMMRVIELAERFVRNGALKRVDFEDLPEERVYNAAEMLLVGTTIDVTAVCRYEGRPVGSGAPGPVWKMLNEALERDIESNSTMRTEVFPRGAPERTGDGRGSPEGEPGRHAP